MLTLEKQNYAYNAYVETLKYLKKSKSLLHPEFSSNSAMYVSTTENFADYIKKIKVEGKSVLTVTGSGDQLINLALLGAKRVDNFDINQNAYFITQLKLAALQALSYEEFIKFFCVADDLRINYMGIVAMQNKVGHNPEAFDFKTYLKIKPYLSEDAAFYWNLLYEEYQYNGCELANSSLFYSATKKAMVQNNAYLKNGKEYNKARESLPNVEVHFMEHDILNIHTLPYSYDVILLSNIYEYLVDQWADITDHKDFVAYIQDQVSKRLNEHGVIAVAYQYNYRHKAFYDLNLISKILGKGYVVVKIDDFNNMKRIVVPTTVKEYREDGGKDCVYLYEKEKVK